MKNKAPHPSEQTGGLQMNQSTRAIQQAHSNSATVQRQRILVALQAAPNGLTTIEMRRDLDVMMPSTRIYELRWDYGHNVKSAWCSDVTESGHVHRVCRYFLMPGAWQGRAA